MPVFFISIDRRNPALGGFTFYFRERVIAFGFKNKKARRRGFQLNDKIGHVVMHLAIVEIRNGKA